MVTVRIWDLPTRLFHWLLVLCVLGLVVTGQMGGNAMLWHFRLGYAVLSLLVFRLVWGFVGGHWSRWQQLPLRLRLVTDYLHQRQTAGTWAGHNPIGSWSVLLMLGWLLLQVGTGLVSDDEIVAAVRFLSEELEHLQPCQRLGDRGHGRPPALRRCSPGQRFPPRRMRGPARHPLHLSWRRPHAVPGVLQGRQGG